MNLFGTYDFFIECVGWVLCFAYTIILTYWWILALYLKNKNRCLTRCSSCGGVRIVDDSGVGICVDCLCGVSEEVK